MAIKLPDAMITFTGEEQYVLALILQSAKRQMENWKQKTAPRHRKALPGCLQPSAKGRSRKSAERSDAMKPFCPDPAGRDALRRLCVGDEVRWDMRLSGRC